MININIHVIRSCHKNSLKIYKIKRSLLWIQLVAFSAVYPSIQEHIPPRQLAYGDPAHWSLKEHDWFRTIFPIQTVKKKRLLKII